MPDIESDLASKEYLCGKHLFSTTELICEVILNRLKDYCFKEFI